MNKTRQLVFGRYKDKNTYNLYLPDGKLFQTIRVGEAFKIGTLTYYPSLILKDDKTGTMIICQRFSKDHKMVLDEFVLHNFKKGLWALNNATARKNVFPWYNAPQNKLEEFLDSISVPREVILRVDTIDRQVKIGGNNPKKVFSIITDSPDYTPDKELHPHIINVYGGTFLIIYHYDLNRLYTPRPIKVLLTPLADENKVLSALKQM